MSGANAPIEPVLRATRKLDDGVELDLLLPADLFYFKGHFPGSPILPGVAQIDWAVKLADHHLGTGIGSAQNFRTKFRRIIGPDHEVTLALRVPKGKAQLNFEYRDADDLLSSGTVAIRSDP